MARTAILIAMAAWVGCAAAAAPAEQAAGVTVLDTGGFWRFRSVWATYDVRQEDGSLALAMGIRTVKKEGKWSGAIEPAPVARRIPAPPPAEWTAPDFDDGTWGRFGGPFVPPRPWTGLICLRGRFAVADPAAAGDLTLSLAYRGGVVVYLNGREVARRHLPGGVARGAGTAVSHTFSRFGEKVSDTFSDAAPAGLATPATQALDPMTPAEDYPREAILDEKGLLLTRRDVTADFAPRIRQADGIRVPGSLLRRGTNVLAVELHRSPAPEAWFSGKVAASLSPQHMPKEVWWPMIGLERIRLSAGPAAAAAFAAPAAGGLQVWNEHLPQKVATTDAGDPLEPLRPIRLCGVANGVFSGQVVVRSASPLKGLAATASPLAGGGGAAIPAGAVEVRYGLADGGAEFNWPWREKSVATFDTLSPAAPAEVPAGQAQPIWLSVRVPADAAAGEYRGTLALAAEGVEPVRVPVHLSVADWRLPDAKRFTTHMGFIESPESVAMQYHVPMWSDAHWALLAKSFAMIGQVAGKEICIPLVAKSHYGNQHSMVRWIPRAGGGYEHDFSIVQKYLDTAIGGLGKVPVVCLYCWELPAGEAPGHFPSGAPIEIRRQDRPIRFTEQDPATGALREVEGPKWGTPQCREFWKPVLAGIRRLLADRGMQGAMMLGVSGDYYPTAEALEDLTAAAPDAPWVVASHTYWSKVGDRPVGCLANVWGMSGVKDPDQPAARGGAVRWYGWKDPFILLRFGRNDFRQRSLLAVYRVYPEGWIVASGRGAGTDGVGRMGADFWPVVKAPAEEGGPVRARTLAGLYAPWGGLDLDSFGVTSVLSPGKDGPLATVRFEALRECLQENEARVFLEKILTDAPRREALGELLAGRVQDLLDERVRAYLAFDIEYQGLYDVRWYLGSDYEGRSRRLYALAAEAAAKCGGKQPT